MTTNPLFPRTQLFLAPTLDPRFQQVVIGLLAVWLSQFASDTALLAAADEQKIETAWALT